MSELLVDQDMLAAGFGYPRTNTPHDIALGEVGHIESGDGVRITLGPHYLRIEVNTMEEEGELWIPTMTLLEAIGNLTKKVGN